MSFLTNLILFSPLLFIGLIILAVLDRAESLRKGAGLQPEKEGEGQGDVVPPSSPSQVEGESTTTSTQDDGGGGGGAGEAEEDGAGGARSPVSGVSGDEGFQIVQGEGEEEEEDVEEEGEEEEEDGDFEFIDHGDDHDPAPGPATAAAAAGGAPPRPLTTPRTKTVGAKKAASLARRDQRRAYNEFQRTRALAAAETARQEEESRADELFAEKQRRAVAEEEISLRRDRERLARLEREREEERVWRGDLELLKRMVWRGEEGGRKVWKVRDLARGLVGERSERWVVEGLEREGLLGVREVEGGGAGEDGGEGGWEGGSEWEMRIVTGKGYYVVVRESEVVRLFESLDESGEKGMSWTEMGRRLEEILALE